MSRRWRDPLVSRRRRLEAPWIPLVQAAPQLPPQALTTKRRIPASRRSRVVPAPAAAPQPTFPTRPRRIAVRARRGRMFETPWTVVATPTLVPGILDPARRKLPVRVRRGGFLPLAWPQQTPPVAPPFVADPVQRPIRIVVIRKGRFAAPPWPQQSVPAAPQFIPEVLQRQLRVVVVRRGRFAVPPWPQQVTAAPVLPPGLTQQNTVCARQSRRGRFLPSPMTQDLPQRTLRQTVRRPAPVRRGKISQPLTIVSLAGPGPLAPKVTRPATRRLVIPRRGRFLAVPMIGDTAASPGFVCQDFTTVATVDAYFGVATVDAYSATRTVDAFAGSFTVDAYTGSATNCGR